MAAEGLHRAQIHTSTRQNEERCAPSRPRLHTRSMQVHERTQSTHGEGGGGGGGDFTGSGCWLSAAVLIKNRERAPGLWIYDRPLHSDLYLSCIRQGVGEWAQLCGLVWTFVWSQCLKLWGVKTLLSEQKRRHSVKSQSFPNIVQTLSRSKLNHPPSYHLKWRPTETQRRSVLTLTMIGIQSIYYPSEMKRTDWFWPNTRVLRQKHLCSLMHMCHDVLLFITVLNKDILFPALGWSTAQM